MENEKSIPRKRTAWNKGTLIVFNLASPAFPTRGGNWRFHSKKRQKRESDQGNGSEKPA